MLVAPDVGEDKPTHVRESRYDWTVVQGVVTPDKGNKVVHHVHMFVVLWAYSSNWKKKAQLYPSLQCFPENVLMQSWDEF